MEIRSLDLTEITTIDYDTRELHDLVAHNAYESGIVVPGRQRSPPSERSHATPAGARRLHEHQPGHRHRRARRVDVCAASRSNPIAPKAGSASATAAHAASAAATMHAAERTPADADW